MGQVTWELDSQHTIKIKMNGWIWKRQIWVNNKLLFDHQAILSGLHYSIPHAMNTIEVIIFSGASKFHEYILANDKIIYPKSGKKQYIKIINVYLEKKKAWSIFGKSIGFQKIPFSVIDNQNAIRYYGTINDYLCIIQPRFHIENNKETESTLLIIQTDQIKNPEKIKAKLIESKFNKSLSLNLDKDLLVDENAIAIQIPLTLTHQTINQTTNLVEEFIQIISQFTSSIPEKTCSIKSKKNHHHDTKLIILDSVLQYVCVNHFNQVKNESMDILDSYYGSFWAMTLKLTILITLMIVAILFFSWLTIDFFSFISYNPIWRFIAFLFFIFTAVKLLPIGFTLLFEYLFIRKKESPPVIEIIE